MYAALANAVLLTHAMFIAFVVLTVPFIYVGKVCNWRWVRLYWLRVVHLLAIAVVAIQAWFGVICPLTTLEMWLRERAGLKAYSGSFIDHWLAQLVYWDLPTWVFTLTYSLFALVVIATWFIVPPMRGSKANYG